MTFLTVRVGDAEFSARLLEERAPGAVEILRAVLPLSVRLLQEEWSGAFLKSVERVVPDGVRCSDQVEPYQAPGRLYLELESGSVAVCYGQGRLQSAVTALPAVPIAEIVGGLAQLADSCRSVQFAGVTEMRVELAPGDVASTEEKEPTGTRVWISLAGAHVAATLLDAERPKICESLKSSLPLLGVATNTHSSGPLVRFWNKTGGSQGETPLEPATSEISLAQSVLYPRYLYYMPKMGFRGIRIPFREPTIMRSAVSGGSAELIAIARFDEDWTAFREAAARLRWEGALPMEFTVLG
jgi:hypothetical protein